MKTTTRRPTDIQAEIDDLLRREHCVAHNEGTYGATECRRLTGCGDVRYGTVSIYETVGGQRRRTGPDEDRMPGRLRWCTPQGLADDRRRLAELRDQLRPAR